MYLKQNFFSKKILNRASIYNNSKDPAFISEVDGERTESWEIQLLISPPYMDPLTQPQVSAECSFQSMVVNDTKDQEKKWRSQLMSIIDLLG